jgi:hypothetical protein
MIKGAAGDWLSYPVYNFKLFDEVQETFNAFPKMFEKNIDTPMSAFLIEKFKVVSIWQALRENSRMVDKFVRACHHKVDGLRILQYIKWRHAQINGRDEENLFRFLQHAYPDDPLLMAIDWKNFNFENADLKDLASIRDSLAAKEEAWQHKIKILE